MKELKIGDKVEIYDDIRKEWQERIFIKFGINDGVICVELYCEDEFYRGCNFMTCYWEKDKWRLIAEKKYRPFNEKDDWVNALKGKWVKRKIYNTISHISLINVDAQIVYVYMYLDYGYVTLKELFDDYVFDDGKIIGVEEVIK